ncbi:hypothetical protein GGP41_001776 [Bipolaris sorokiniana]|uniref:Uncharacterized protein n=2 Tax=Cochliobolus sativus TaxID=45130 RepID=A0A8H6DYZ9_COCSA|nr:uncharacterized protein COCSADRAFT_270275 [Bipolaris sorokiniana ND90Pr]EMD68218.1 hypothetical protein COCSADRAFT_270275 [Bipolaris sorokiniana ND90Pr]KAF5853169.1 hypothetical protein GGP41_001776 [Bipolaris sorokiniana]
MSSYFDLPPQKVAPPECIEQIPQEQRKQLGRTSSLMSPAVAQILEGLGNDHSSSSEEDSDLSDDQEKGHPKSQSKKDISAQKIQQKKQKLNSAQAPRPSSLSPNRSRSRSRSATRKVSNMSSSADAKEASSDRPKNKQPQMARFHSLRSILFQQKIEDRLRTATQEDCKKEVSAAETWQNQHKERQMHHPTTPEKHAQVKSGIGSRLKMTLRRMTTRDAGGMEKIKEDGAPVEFKDRPSTLSSENEEKQPESKKATENDDASIKDTDVDDLVRWVSRRGSSGEGEVQKDDTVEGVKDDIGQDSLGHSNIQDPVHHARRKSSTKDVQDASDEHLGYSDAPTESDTELSSDEEENADDLVRWISHRDRSKAGPVRRNLQREELDSDVEEHYDSDVPEIGRWYKRHDATSGESAATTPIKETFEQQQIEEEEENRGRPRSRELPEPPAQEKTHLSSSDVDELVRWISSKNLKRPDTPLSQAQTQTGTPESTQDEKKQAVGMSLDQGSLSHRDVQELIEHVRKTSTPTDDTAPDSSSIERGDLKNMQRENSPSTRDPQLELEGKREDIRNKEKEEQLGMSMQDASLSHGDIEDLLAHVRSK